jgi:hypothetical protein
VAVVGTDRVGNRVLVVAQQRLQALQVLAPLVDAGHRAHVVSGALQRQRGVQALGQRQVRAVHPGSSHRAYIERDASSFMISLVPP